jgi:hypothetical protein
LNEESEGSSEEMYECVKNTIKKKANETLCKNNEKLQNKLNDNRIFAMSKPKKKHLIND